MLKTPKSLPPQIKLPPAQDFNYLKDEALINAQHLSGDVWTDYNDHDPGVTIIEQFCFALTELDLKANLNIEDLLFLDIEKENQRNDLFYAPSEVLPTAPISTLDYRKYFLDACYPDLANVWIEPIEQNKQGIPMSGLYQLTLLPFPDTNIETLKIKAEKAFSMVRSLGEDLERIHCLKPLELKLDLNIDLKAEEEPEQVVLSLLKDIDESLLKLPKGISLSDWEKEGLPLDVLLEGPLPKYFFMRDEDLERSSREDLLQIDISKLVKNIKRQPSVARVNRLLFRKHDTSEKRQYSVSKRQTQFFEVGHEYYPLLNVGLSSFKIYINDLRYEIDLALLENRFKAAKAQRREVYTPIDYSGLLPQLSSSLKVKDILNYSSIRDSLPRTYGVGDYGLSVRATETRKRQAQQLKGYLLLFDQILTNHLAQLTNLRKLFSVKLDENGAVLPERQTYFAEAPSYLKDNILREQDQLLEEELDPQVTVESILANHDNTLDRKLRFLDHLLARFGESLLMRAEEKISIDASLKDTARYEQDMMEARMKLLKMIPLMGHNRSASSLGDGASEVSGLEMKLAFLFGMKDYHVRPLLKPIQAENTFFKVKKASTSKLQHDGKGFVFQLKDEHIREWLLAFGNDRSNYEIVQKGKKYEILCTNPVDGATFTVFIGNTLEDCETAMEQLFVKIERLNHDCEGMHLVEHIKLRPTEEQQFQIECRSGIDLLLKTKPTKEVERHKNDFMELVKVLSKKAKLLKQDDKAKTLILFDEKGNEIARSPKAKDTKQLAEWKKKLLALSKNKSLRTNFHAQEVLYPWSVLSEDPYSFEVSLILPNWPARFQKASFRTLLEEQARHYTPAHLNLNVKWLSIEEMEEFERLFFKWDELDKKGGDGRDQLSYDLFQFMNGIPTEAERLAIM